MKVKSLSCVRLLVTPWTVAYQASLFGFFFFLGKSTVVGRHCLLLRRNNLPQTNDASLTQKWMFTCHLVISGPSHQDQELRMRVPSPLRGAPFAQCFCLLKSPSPNIPRGISR